MLNASSIIKTGLFLLLTLCLAGPDVRGQEYQETGKKHSWFSFSKPAKKNPADQMEYAQQLLKDNRVKKAGKAFRSLVVTWPGSAEAPMAQWAYARILDNRGESLDAFDEYQKLMEDYSGRFPEYNKALQRQFDIATNLMFTKKAKFLMFPGFDAPERAIPLFENIIANGPRSANAPEAQYLMGLAYERSFQYELAVVAYIATLHRYPLSPFAEQAAFGRARSLYTLSNEYPNDIETMNEAWAGIMVFLRAFPQSEHIPKAIEIRDDLLARKAKSAFNIANFYDQKAKKPTAAKKSYQNFLDLYPNSEWTDEAKTRMIELADVPEKTEKEKTDE